MGLPTDAACDKILGDFDSMMSQVGMGERSLNGEIRDTKNELNDISSFSDSGTLQSLANSYLNQAEDIIPNIQTRSTFDEVVDAIESCTYLGDNLPDPLSLVSGMEDSAKNGLSDLMDSVFGAVPELNAGKLIDSLVDKLGVDGLGFTDLIPNMDKALNCLSGICGQDVSSRINNMNSTMESLFVADDGSFDVDSLLDDVGFNSTQKNNINTIVNTSQSAKSNLTQSISDSKDFIKGLL